MKLIYFFQFILITLFLSACKTNTSNYNIPNVAVDQYVYLSNPSSFEIQFQGGWIENVGGYKGLIVYRRYLNNDQSDFVAYERACPNHYNKDCGKLSVEDNTYLTCSCSQNQYILFDGSPIDFSSQNVKFYRTVFDGINTIHITN